MDAGRLLERVSFDLVVGTPDGSGGEVRAWSQQFTCWAEFIYSRGSEAVDAARLQGRAIYKVKVLASTETKAITTDWRLRTVRRGLPSGVGADALPGNRFNIREADAITDPAWVYLVVELGAAV